MNHRHINQKGEFEVSDAATPNAPHVIEVDRGGHPSVAHSETDLHKRRIDAEAAATFVRMHAHGTSLREIARASGWCASAISRAINRARRRQDLGYLSAGGHARAAANRTARAVRPAGITGEAGSPEWFLTNTLSFRAWLRRARARTSSEGGSLAGAHGNTSESPTVPGSDESIGCRTMHEIETALARVGCRISDPALKAEVCFALGEEAANARVREILESDAARSRPWSALRLALESTLAAADVVQMLESMPTEVGEFAPAKDTGSARALGGGTAAVSHESTTPPATRGDSMADRGRAA